MWPEVIAEALSERGNAPLKSLTAVVDALRKGVRRQAAIRTEELCVYLEHHPSEALALGTALHEVVTRSHATLLLTESGVPDGLGFASALFQRLSRRLVPDLDDPEDLRTVLRVVFHKDDDYRWVDSVPDSLWLRLLTALGIGEHLSSPVADEEHATALRILTHHVASLGLQPEITHRLPTPADTDSPFLTIPTYVHQYLMVLEEDHPADHRKEVLNDALANIQTCRAQVEKLREEKSLYGTSLRLTALSLRLLRLLDRLELLLHLTATRGDALRTHLVSLLREVVQAENTRNHIRPHLKASADLLAFQVVEHAAKKGSKYITSGRKDYGMFFVASLGGGLIVALFALVKILMKPWSLPLGVEALLYGINYSICFVVIYLTGAALATKQPAMTANTLARSLDGSEKTRHLERLESLIVRVWRSQFISFAGNLLMALPVAFLLSYIFHLATDTTVADVATSQKILEGIDPWPSGALAYAAVAGIFLFVAGLVAGWVDNRNLYLRLPQRIAQHPALVRMFGADRAQRAGAFIDRNLGILAGNVVLGFCLGSMGSIGEILGLPLDIRHIAFSSAEFGVALEVLGEAIPSPLLLKSMLGVALIGLVNFLVSFGLSLGMALESRQVTFGETRRLLGLLARRAFRRPLDWFFPPRQMPTPSGASGN